ncbi:Mitochondrial import receptor subunit TOM20-like [Heracleum sosnowskyi]|uniref:Mitochondrial import receptor subunit TOM20-like n=1 Tax=Heracleum sosnowskyi TaxID=360622 RepID=A0AAD8M2D0_9APIA|nr:Mitochondrial import receptor subunit TOM20-like [Heracleum sosnowskyi]
MVQFNDKFLEFFNNRWLVFVAAMWIQSCAGIGYLFGSISPAIKSSLNYNQKQVARLGVAKDLGDSVGFLAGSLCEILPMWAALLVGAAQNFIGYGVVWLVVTGRAPVLPLWTMCLLIFVGTNGETYFNTAALVSCVQNFPKSRGPVVGILKGFAGLSGAILSQEVTDKYGHRMVLVLHLSIVVIIIFTVILFIIIIVPIVIPIWLVFTQKTEDQAHEALLTEARIEEPVITGHDANEIIFSEVEDEKPRGVDLLPAMERQKRIAQLQTMLAQAAAEGAVRVKRRRGPHRGEDFTLMQALIKADFWIIFFSLLLGSGSGLTVIDNLGQMSQSIGYNNTHIFVSLISIWNFLGRVGGGYFSEIIVKDYAYPRHLAMAIAQFIMAFGHFFMAMGWPGEMYVGTLLIGLGYGAHWAIVPAAASELFGLKKFGALYNFLTLANPAGTLILSSLLASSIYDSEAAKQAQGLPFSLDEPPRCYGVVCFSLTLFIMSGLCILAVILSMTLVYRTRAVYANLYGRSRT